MKSYQLSFHLCIGYGLIYISLLVGNGKNHGEKSWYAFRVSDMYLEVPCRVLLPSTRRIRVQRGLEVPVLHSCSMCFLKALTDQSNVNM